MRLLTKTLTVVLLFGLSLLLTGCIGTKYDMQVSSDTISGTIKFGAGKETVETMLKERHLEGEAAAKKIKETLDGQETEGKKLLEMLNLPEDVNGYVEREDPELYIVFEIRDMGFERFNQVTKETLSKLPQPFKIPYVYSIKKEAENLILVEQQDVGTGLFAEDPPIYTSLMKTKATFTFEGEIDSYSRNGSIQDNHTIVFDQKGVVNELNWVYATATAPTQPLNPLIPSVLVAACLVIVTVLVIKAWSRGEGNRTKPKG